MPRPEYAPMFMLGIDYHRERPDPGYCPWCSSDGGECAVCGESPVRTDHDRKRFFAAAVLLACVLGMTLLAVAAVAVNCVQAAEGR